MEYFHAISCTVSNAGLIVFFLSVLVITIGICYCRRD